MKVTAQEIIDIYKQLFYCEEFLELGETEFIDEYGIDIIGKSMKAFYLDTVIDPRSSQEYTQLKVNKNVVLDLQEKWDLINQAELLIQKQ